MTMMTGERLLNFLALIAYKHGEISIGRCREITGYSTDKIREELDNRIGKDIPEKNV